MSTLGCNDTKVQKYSIRIDFNKYLSITQNYEELHEKKVFILKQEKQWIKK